MNGSCSAIPLAVGPPHLEPLALDALVVEGEQLLDRDGPVVDVLHEVRRALEDALESVPS